MLKHPPSNAGDAGSTLGQGTKPARSLSMRATTREPACHSRGSCVPQQRSNAAGGGGGGDMYWHNLLPSHFFPLIILICVEIIFPT